MASEAPVFISVFVYNKEKCSIISLIVDLDPPLRLAD